MAEFREIVPVCVASCVWDADGLRDKERYFELVRDRLRVFLVFEPDTSIETESVNVAECEIMWDIVADDVIESVAWADGDFVPIDGVIVTAGVTVVEKDRDCALEMVTLAVEVAVGRLSETECEDLDRDGCGGSVAVMLIVSVSVAEGVGDVVRLTVAVGVGSDRVLLCNAVGVCDSVVVPASDKLLVGEEVKVRLGVIDGESESVVVNTGVCEKVSVFEGDGVLDSVLLWSWNDTVRLFVTVAEPDIVAESVILPVML